MGDYPEGYSIPLRDRFNKEYVVFEEKYNDLTEKDIEEMFKDRDKLILINFRLQLFTGKYCKLILLLYIENYLGLK